MHHATIEAETLKSAILEDINGILADEGIPPWELNNLGNLAEFVPEVAEVTDHRKIGPGRIEIEFRMRIPGGEDQKVRIRFGGRLIYVLPLLNFCHGNEDLRGLNVGLVKRWRIEKGGISLEIPHALMPHDIDPAMDEDSFGSPAHRVLASAFGDVFIESMGAAKIVKCGQFLVKGEWRPAECHIFTTMVQQAFPRKRGDGEIFLMHWNKIPGLLKQGTYITDMNAAAVLSLAAQRFPAL